MNEEIKVDEKSEQKIQSKRRGAERRPDLGVLDVSLGSTVASLGGEQTLQQLRLVE